MHFIERHKRIFFGLLVILMCVIVIQYRAPIDNIHYGVSFSEYRSDQMGVDWKKTFDATVDDLHIIDFRLASHWQYIEPQPGVYNFDNLDYQVKRLEDVGGTAILVLGRRQPGWPECHTPQWARDLSQNDRNEAQIVFMTNVVNHYKSSKAIVNWQVENEPFLSSFAYDECGPIDKAFFEKEIETIKNLDNSRHILVTDSGNIGTWFSAYKYGDLFGTSVYVYLWSPTLGAVESFLPPAWYRAKYNIMRILFGKKDALLIELSLEPWLLQPIKDTDIEIQMERMGLDKMQHIIEYASHTGLQKQYLWGVEWWYWLKEKGIAEQWNFIKNTVNS